MTHRNLYGSFGRFNRWDFKDCNELLRLIIFPLEI